MMVSSRKRGVGEKRTKLTKLSSSGVSPVVGAVLMFVIAMIFLSIMQTQLVPSLCRSQEANNAKAVEKALSEFTLQLSSGKSATLALDTVHYRKYPFLLFPPSPPLIVKVQKYNVTVDYNATLPNGSVVHRTVNLTTSRVVVGLGYFYYPPTSFVYENTALFKREGNATLTVVSPQLSNETVKLVIVNAKERSVATNSPVSLSFTPVAVGEFYAKNLTIRFRSICPQAWAKYAEVNGNEVVLKGENVNVLVYTYSEGDYTPAGRNFTLIPLGPDRYTITNNDSISLSVMAVDSIFAPVPGVVVNVSVTGGIGTVSPETVTTGRDGVVSTVFHAQKAGSGYVVFNASGKVVKYYITVGKLPTFYTTYWVDKSYYENRTITRITPLYAKVTRNGEPVANALVYFGVNNSSVVKIGNAVGEVYMCCCPMMCYYVNVVTGNYTNYTNSSGITTIYVQPIENGTVSVYCYSGGSGDTLTLRVRVNSSDTTGGGM